MKNLNFETYQNQDPKELSDARRFFIRHFVYANDSFLDIGGATGTFLHLVNETIPINGTVLDSDRDCIEWGRQNRPHIRFIENCFLNHKQGGLACKYDHVSMWSLLPHLGNWKTIIKEMVRFANKSIMFSSILKTEGTTVVDNDVSYFYYFNTGKRMYQVIHNIYELCNFLCLEEIRAKKIICLGQSVIDDTMKKQLKGQNSIQTPDTMHVFRGISPFEQYNADWLVELWPEDKNPKRMGGAGGETTREGYKFYLPDIQVWLDGEIFIGAQNNGWIFKIPEGLK